MLNDDGNLIDAEAVARSMLNGSRARSHDQTCREVDDATQGIARHRGNRAGGGRADTIYANKIEADNIQGQIHQTKDVKVGKTSGKIKAPEVAAAVIYAEEITANSVVARNIYVRDLDRR